ESSLLPSDRRRQAFTIWFSGRRFDGSLAERVQRVLADNPYTTLQVVLEPTAELPEPGVFDALLAACHANPTYLDKYYALQPRGETTIRRGDTTTRPILRSRILRKTSSISRRFGKPPARANVSRRTNNPWSP